MLLRMQALPKIEYEMMKDMLKRYGFPEHSLVGPSELFAVLVRLGDEVLRYDPPTGEQWMLRIIQEVRGAKIPPTTVQNSVGRT